MRVWLCECRTYHHNHDMRELSPLDAGKMLTEGVDPSRGIWQNWQDLRGSSAQHWYPKAMKVVAFVFNKVTSSLHQTVLSQKWG